MQRRLCLALVLTLTLLLCACAGIDKQDKNASLPKNTSSSFETVSSEKDEQATTEPAHSELYLPNCSVQQMLEYFEEVVLSMEYSDDVGNTSLVQKWASPIYYRIYGEPTHKDQAVLTQLFLQLNEVEGFPGIFAAADGEVENLTISFLEPDDFDTAFSDFLNGEDAYGATQFWYYIATNEIHTASIGYRTDIDQTTRNSILVEEIINMLGISDTVLREDSIVYQYSNDNMVLSDVDWAILKLLYDPNIRCGMDADSCRVIFRELYY